MSVPLGLPRGPASPSAGGLTGQDVLRIIRKRKWLILLSVAVCVAAAAAVTGLWLMYSPLYTASGYVEVNPPGETDLQRGTMAAEVMDRRKMDVARMAKTEPVLRKTTDDPRVLRTAWWRHNRGEPVIALMKVADVNPIRDTNLIELSMTGTNRDELPEIVNAWVDAFLEDAKNSANQDRETTIKRLEGQQTDLRTQISGLDRNIGNLDYRDERVIQHKITTLTQELQTLTTRVTELGLLIDVETAAKSDFERKKDENKLDQLAEMVDAFERDPLLRQLRADLIGYTTASEALRQKAGEQNKAYREYCARIESITGQITKREKKVRDSTILLLKDSYDRRLQMLVSQRQAITRNMDAAQNQVTALQKNLRDLVDFQIEKARRQETVEMLERRLLDVRLALRGQVPAFARQIATKPLKPSMPRWGLMVPLGLLLGLVVGFGLAFLLEFVDTSIKSPSDISRRVDLPLLGMVPHTADLEDEIEDLRLAFLTNPNSLVGEAFRQIRTCLQFSAPASQLRSLLITSALPGDGRGTVTMNLAAATAHGGRKILVVDANFRQPMVKKIFPQIPEAGLSNALVGQAHWKDLVREIHPNLYAMAAGPLPPNPAELLGSDAMRSLLAEAIDEYDQVLFDGPPCLLVTDAAVLSTLVDGVVLVVRAAANTHGVVQRARDVLGRVGARVLGVVLNGIRVTSGGYLRKNYRTFYEYHSQETPLST